MLWPSIFVRLVTSFINTYFFSYLSICLLLSEVAAYWDKGTTTPKTERTNIRQSRFAWMKTESNLYQLFFPSWDWEELWFRKRLFVIAGISHDFINLSTATILNRRTLITSANYLDPYMDKQTELRIWALGRRGDHDTPWRYRVWRVTRLLPRSLNPEHQHGPYGYHSPIHDVALIHSLDQMYIYRSPPGRYHLAYRSFIPLSKNHRILSSNNNWFAGSGFEYLQHIYENYNIYYHKLKREWCIDCSKYLPSWWGKFICFKNILPLPGLQNGGGLFDDDYIVGIGCFEIRYNDDRIFVFTDLRYYLPWITEYATLWPGEYYEYAYPQWGLKSGYIYDGGSGNNPYIPHWQIESELFPLGKK